MEKQFIDKLIENQPVKSVFQVGEKSLLTGKNGKSYLSISLRDKSGAVDARLWDNVEQVAPTFEIGDFVKIKGLVQIFQNRQQVVIHKIERAPSSEVVPQDFVETAGLDVEKLFGELMVLVDGMADVHLKQLVKDVLEDPEIKPRFATSPAAKTIHHAYTGGMLEHVLSICRLMKAVAKNYPQLREDLLIFGAIFHDIGKIWEISSTPGFHYTDEGRMLGHITIAVELIEKKTARIFGFPEKLKLMCKHIVLSHHGKVEYGSPKEPQFLEAYVVAAIDEFDSKMNIIGRFMETEKKSGESWTRYNPHFNRYFYLE